MARRNTLNDNKGLIRDYVHDTLLQYIMELSWEPGRYVSEKEVVELLRVSRSPVREAFIRLAQEGLIETVPQKGSFVSLIDLAQVEESRFIRETLECAIIRLACERLSKEHLLNLNNLIALQELSASEHNYERLFELDEEFHRTIVVGCGKKKTWELIQQLFFHYNRLRLLRLASSTDWDNILSQHRSIVQAMQERDPDKAEQVMRNHLNRVLFETEELKSKYPSYFK